MRFPLTARFVAEAEGLALRSGCRHCFHFVADGGAPVGGGRCGNGWPLEGQERSPAEAAPTPGGRSSPRVHSDGAVPPPTEVVFCREFELA